MKKLPDGPTVDWRDIFQDLREFEGKALVQKVNDKHQVFTKPTDVIPFMLDNYVPDVNK